MYIIASLLSLFEYIFIYMSHNSYLPVNRIGNAEPAESRSRSLMFVAIVRAKMSTHTCTFIHLTFVQIYQVKDRCKKGTEERKACVNGIPRTDFRDEIPVARLFKFLST